MGLVCNERKAAQTPQQLKGIRLFECAVQVENSDLRNNTTSALTCIHVRNKAAEWSFEDYALLRVNSWKQVESEPCTGYCREREGHWPHQRGCRWRSHLEALEEKGHRGSANLFLFRQQACGIWEINMTGNSAVSCSLWSLYDHCKRKSCQHQLLLHSCMLVVLKLETKCWSQ